MMWWCPKMDKYQVCISLIMARAYLLNWKIYFRFSSDLPHISSLQLTVIGIWSTMDPMIESKLGHLTFNHDFFAYDDDDDDDDDDNGGDDAEDNALIH